MLDLARHCGSVRVRTDTQPGYVNACNCTLCAKTGARWAYYDPSAVSVTGPTTAYVRRDKADVGAEIHFCPVCGATSHFVLTELTIAQHGNTVMGVNAALAEEADLAGVELRFPDGRAWPGSGPFGYVREAVVIGGAPAR